MRAFIAPKINNKSDMWVMGDDDLIYHIKEGTGDALEQQDIDDGYVDYIYIDIYKNNLTDINEDNISDGGFILLKTPYADLSVEDLLGIVEEFHGVKFFSISEEDWKKTHAAIKEDIGA